MLKYLAIGALAYLLLTSDLVGRTYTKADVPKLRELMLVHAGLGRELRLCVAKAQERSLLSATQVIGIVGGLAVGAVSMNFATALKVARGTTATLESLGLGRGVDCAAAIAKLRSDVARLEALCKELGLPPTVAYSQLMAIVAGIGDGTGFRELDKKAQEDAYARCVRVQGKAYCDEFSESAPGHPNRIV